jgi:hypothetical protein
MVLHWRSTKTLFRQAPLPSVTGRLLLAITKGHTDFDLICGQHFDELGPGELAAPLPGSGLPSNHKRLIGVEDLGRTVARKRLLHCFNAKIRFQRDPDPPGQHPAGEPVQHGGELDEPAPSIAPFSGIFNALSGNGQAIAKQSAGRGNVGDVHRPAALQRMFTCVRVRPDCAG